MVVNILLFFGRFNLIKFSIRKLYTLNINVSY